MMKLPMKNYIWLFAATFLSLGVHAQTPQSKRCATVEYVNYRESVQPGYQHQTEKAFQAARSKAENAVNKSTTTYTIPVVVHVVYNTAAQNIPDSVIYNQIQILNEDYNRENADSVNLRSEFFPVVGRGKIRFELATIDPSGNPTTGITRTQTTHATFLDMLGFLGGDMSSTERVKSSANGGINPWNQSKYLNIWVCNMAVSFMGQETPMLMGYATPPSGLPNWPAGSTDGMSDGVVIQYQVFGRNNPNPLVVSGSTQVVKGRTVTHEVGHYLGLRHIWGDDASCSVDDGVSDTPNATAESDFDCNKTKNTCTNDQIGGVDLPDMVENFMDYSAEDCQNTFTDKQIQLMRAVLENQRFDLIDNNLAISESKQAHFTLYPNPAKTEVVLGLTENEATHVRVLELQGKLIQEFPVVGSNTVINVSNLQSGIYQVEVTLANGTKQVVKLMKL